MYGSNRNCLDLKSYQNSLIRRGGDDAGTGSSTSVIINNNQNSLSTSNEPNKSKLSHSDVRILFDSQYASEVNASNGQISFNTSTSIDNFKISDVVAIKIKPFLFPTPNRANKNGPDLLFFNRVYIYLSTFSGRNCVRTMVDNTSYHFEMEVESAGTMLRLIPNESVHTFPMPYNSIVDSISMQFFDSNFRPIMLPNQFCMVQPVPGSNPARFNLASGSINDFVTDANTATFPLAVSVAVRLSTGSTNNSGINDQMGASNGFLITSFVTPQQFEVAGMDFSSLVTTSNISIEILKNRIVFELGFTRLKQGGTSNMLSYVRD